MASFKLTGRDLGDIVLNRLRNSMAVYLVLVLFFELTRHLTNLYATEHHAVEAFILTGDSISIFQYWNES